MQPSRLVKMPATERLPKGGVIALLTPSHQYIFWTDWTLQKIWKMAPWDELPDLMAEYDRQVSQVHLRSCCFRRIYMTTQTRTRQAEWKTLRNCLSTVANCNNLVKPFTHTFLISWSTCLGFKRLVCLFISIRKKTCCSMHERKADLLTDPL